MNMNKTGLILIFSLIAFGCSQPKAPENKAPQNIAPTVQNGSAGKAETNANKTESQQSVTGEKIEKPLEINFKDGFPKGWEWIDSDKDTKYETKESGLSIKIPSAKDLYASATNAPRLLKAVTGNFEIETRVKFSPTENYQGAGILIYNDEKNYIRLERGFGGTGGGDSGVRLDRSEKGSYDAITTPDKFPTEAKQVDLKIVRKGKDFKAFWRENEDGEWKLVGEYSADYPETVKIGLIGVNTAAEITAEFAYIKLAPV